MVHAHYVQRRFQGWKLKESGRQNAQVLAVGDASKADLYRAAPGLKIEPDSSMLSAEKVLILASDNFVVWTGEIEAEKIMFVCVAHFSNMHPVVLLFSVF